MSSALKQETAFETEFNVFQVYMEVFPIKKFWNDSFCCCFHQYLHLLFSSSLLKLSFQELKSPWVSDGGAGLGASQISPELISAWCNCAVNWLTISIEKQKKEDCSLPTGSCQDGVEVFHLCFYINQVTHRQIQCLGSNGDLGSLMMAVLHFAVFL